MKKSKHGNKLQYLSRRVIPANCKLNQYQHEKAVYSQKYEYNVSLMCLLQKKQKKQ